VSDISADADTEVEAAQSTMHALRYDEGDDDSAIAALDGVTPPPVPPARRGRHLLSDLSASEMGCKDPSELMYGAWVLPAQPVLPDRA